MKTKRFINIYSHFPFVKRVKFNINLCDSNNSLMKVSMNIFKFLIISFLFSLLVNSCTHNHQSISEGKPALIFEDSMSSSWQEKWFLDGEKATLEHRKNGLYFAGGTITKKQDPEEYHSHHAVLWTKQVFEGELLITFEMTRIDNSNYGNTLLYIQAQGIGKGPYVEDISNWNSLREVPSMSKYFTYMNLLSLSFRETLRCKRYPLRDMEGNAYKGAMFEPKAKYDGILPGKTYKVEVIKKNPLFTVRLYDAVTNKLVKKSTWDVSKNPKEQMLRLVHKGRIGIRHMSTKQFIYRNFKVQQL